MRAYEIVGQISTFFETSMKITGVLVAVPIVFLVFFTAGYMVFSTFYFQMDKSPIPATLTTTAETPLEKQQILFFSYNSEKNQIVYGSGGSKIPDDSDIYIDIAFGDGSWGSFFQLPERSQYRIRVTKK